MAFSFLAHEAGRVHVCGHRGYSLHYPENTMPAFAAAKAWGATTIEIDVVLTAEGEPIVLHDHTLDRSTDGHGFAADFALEQIRRLDAGAHFSPRFAGTRVPTLVEVVDWAGARRSGSLWRSRRPNGQTSPSIEVVETIEARGAADRTIIIGFDHVVLKRAVERHPGIVTQAIIHARHVDILWVLRACGAGSVSIELDILHPDDANAVHDAGFSIRVNLPRSEALAAYWQGGRDIVSAVVQWIAEGLIDTVSGDDVPFLARLVERAGRADR